MNDAGPVTALEAAHEHLLDRYRLADTDRGDGSAFDPQERAILDPLVDVADHLRRIADHGGSTHYRADKAGALLHAAARVNRRAMLAYLVSLLEELPDDDTPQERAIEEAHTMLSELITGIRGVMWVESRGEQHDQRDTADLVHLADRFATWARSVDDRAVEVDDDEQ